MQQPFARQQSGRRLMRLFEHFLNKRRKATQRRTALKKPSTLSMPSLLIFGEISKHPGIFQCKSLLPSVMEGPFDRKHYWAQLLGERSIQRPTISWRSLQCIHPTLREQALHWQNVKYGSINQMELHRSDHSTCSVREEGTRGPLSHSDVHSHGHWLHLELPRASPTPWVEVYHTCLKVAGEVSDSLKNPYSPPVAPLPLAFVAARYVLVEVPRRVFLPVSPVRSWTRPPDLLHIREHAETFLPEEIPPAFECNPAQDSKGCGKVKPALLSTVPIHCLVSMLQLLVVSRSIMLTSKALTQAWDWCCWLR